LRIIFKSSRLTEESDLDDSLTQRSSFIDDPNEILEEIERLQKEEMEMMFGNAPCIKFIFKNSN